MPIQFPTQFSSSPVSVQPSYDSTTIIVGVVAIGIFTGLYFYRRSLLSEKQIDILKTPPLRTATPASPETPTNSGEYFDTISGSPTTDMGTTDSSFDFSSPEEEGMKTPLGIQSLGSNFLRYIRYRFSPTNNRAPGEVADIDPSLVKKLKPEFDQVQNPKEKKD